MRRTFWFFFVFSCFWVNARSRRNKGKLLIFMFTTVDNQKIKFIRRKKEKRKEKNCELVKLGQVLIAYLASSDNSSWEPRSELELDPRTPATLAASCKSPQSFSTQLLSEGPWAWLSRPMCKSFPGCTRRECFEWRPCRAFLCLNGAHLELGEVIHVTIRSFALCARSRNDQKEEKENLKHYMMITRDASGQKQKREKFYRINVQI